MQVGIWETTNKKGVHGVSKTPEEPNASGGWGNRQPGESPRGG